MSDIRVLAVVALVATVPITICLLVAMLRGYTIHVSLTRERPDRD